LVVYLFFYEKDLFTVDELIASFTYDIEIKFMLPGIQPTGKYVELPLVVVMKFRGNYTHVMKFRGNKIAYEHIYWDQASLLTQIGLLDATNLPIKGIEQSEKLNSHQSRTP
jgi:carboxymethylenebutenolidase